MDKTIGKKEVILLIRFGWEDHARFVICALAPPSFKEPMIFNLDRKEGGKGAS